MAFTTNGHGPVKEVRDTHEDTMASNNKDRAAGDEFVRQITCQKVRETMQKLQVDLIEQMDERLTEMVSEVMREVELTGLIPQHFNENNKYKNRKKSDKPGGLPDKHFVPRNSLLTDLFDIKHIRTIYNIFIVILIILFLNAVADDIMSGNFRLSLGFIQWSFGQFRSAVALWACMCASTFAVYACFYWWATRRAKFVANSWSQKAWDYGWLAVLIVYQLSFVYFPARCVIQLKLPPASAFSVLAEQIRMIMKSHAFVRSNAPRALSYKPHGDAANTTACPGFSNFLFFYFCPTLVYRDNYPRTKSIRWKFVGWNLMEVVGVIFYMSFIFERFFVPTYREFGLRPSSHEDRIVQVFGTILPAMLAYLCGFYCLLHSWMNACAEMLRFADKMFYQDWWNANSYGAFYRMWNVVVHDWLYTYIYKDVCENFLPNRRFVPMMAVFAISALVHEYVLALTFGFFYPMLMITFGCFGMSLVFMTSDKAKGGNVFMWLCLSTGTGLMASVYCMEWYSRINCQQTYDVVVDFFIPRSWTCVPIKPVESFA